jgi:hypothetical protein
VAEEVVVVDVVGGYDRIWKTEISDGGSRREGLHRGPEFRRLKTMRNWLKRAQLQNLRFGLVCDELCSRASLLQGRDFDVFEALRDVDERLLDRHPLQAGGADEADGVRFLKDDGRVLRL